MRKIAAQYLYPLKTQPIRNGFLLIDDEGIICEIGQLSEETESTEFYNGIICPGFVNSHCHIELSHLKGHFTQDSGMAGFIRQINKLRLSVSQEERAFAIKKEMDSLYNSGVDAMADISNCDESFPFKAESKMYTRTYLEVFGTETADAASITSGVLELSETASKYGIDAAPTPHSCYTMSSALMESSLHHGLKSGFISYHNQESWEEEELLKSGTGPLADEYNRRGLSTPPITGEPALLYFLDRLKAAAQKEVIDQEKILLVHNTFTNQQSINAALETVKNVYWAICPNSNIFIHRSLPPLELFRKNSLKITLGTDSLSSNTSLSITDEILTLHKYFPQIELNEILLWACYNGAEAIGKEGSIGSFEVGKRPGVVLLDNIDWNNHKITDNTKSVRLL